MSDNSSNGEAKKAKIASILTALVVLAKTIIEIIFN